VANIEAMIQLELLAERQFTECPEMILEEGAGYTATLQTEKGDIVIELFPEIAPMAVNSFVFLAQNDWFDDVTFHRVLPGFVAQAGDPTGTGYGGPGYSFAIEIAANSVFDRAGLLAMANSGPTSNGSQFFITLGPATHLNGLYTIFGEVIRGMDIVESLTPRDPTTPGLPPGDLILDVTIEVH
jgi:cyclophilin family peptidyl-prolyl cis-trans isomerase